MKIVTLLQALLASVVEAQDVSESVASRHLVKLHRQRVPVQGESSTISYKSVYFGSVFVGAPKKQEFSVVFDTGSGHLVVPSIGCKEKTCKIHRQYDRRESELAIDIDYDGTHVQPGQPRDQITVAFGTGEITGQFVSDRMCLGGEPVPGDNASAIAEDCIVLRVVMATHMTHEPFHSFAFDGVLGLGLESLALAPEFSVFGELTKQGRAGLPMFGVFLADSDEESSAITFGGHAEDQHTPLEWAPVIMLELGHWMVAVKAVRVGNKTLDYCTDGTCKAVVDTGTSLLAVPVDFSDTLYDELVEDLVDPPMTEASDDPETADCKKAKGSLLEFDIDGGDGSIVTISLGPGDYARPAISMEDEEGNSTDYESEDSWENSRCEPTLMPIELPEPLGPKLFIWGEPILRKYYTVYDVGQKRVGFGLSVHIADDDEEPAEPVEGSVI